MHITEGFNQPRAAAVSVGGFIRRHNRASIAVAVGLGIGGPRRPIHSHKEVIHHDVEPGFPATYRRSEQLNSQQEP